MTSECHPGCDVVFFVDMKKHRTTSPELTVRQILMEFAHEDPAHVILALREEKDYREFHELDHRVPMKNGQLFVVFDNCPAQVS